MMEQTRLTVSACSWDTPRQFGLDPAGTTGTGRSCAVSPVLRPSFTSPRAGLAGRAAVRRELAADRASATAPGAAHRPPRRLPGNDPHQLMQTAHLGPNLA